MPTYEYECRKCTHRFEAFQQITQEPLKECPKCKGQIRRLISPGAGFIFKGSGFYSTDYRSREYKDRQRKEEGKDKPAACPGSGDSQECKACPANKNKDGE